jgi:hypothetical protein
LNNKQELELGTSPNSSDSDSDGISDGEEITSGHDPQSNQSYPPRLNIALRTAYTDSLTRRGCLESNWPPYLYPEMRYNGSPWMPTSSVLTWVATMPFPDQAPDNLLRIVSNGRRSFYGLYRQYNGELTQCRYWLQTKPASNVEIKRTFLKLTTGYRQPTIGSVNEELFPPIVEKLEVTIPANSTASLPIDIMPPLDFPPEFYTEISKRIHLLPVEFEVKHTEIDPTTGQVVNPRANKMLRDEIVNIRIKVPTLNNTDWTIDLRAFPDNFLEEIKQRSKETGKTMAHFIQESGFSSQIVISPNDAIPDKEMRNNPRK